MMSKTDKHHRICVRFDAACREYDRAALMVAQKDREIGECLIRLARIRREATAADQAYDRASKLYRKREEEFFAAERVAKLQREESCG
jgi:hypothetical protein